MKFFSDCSGECRHCYFHFVDTNCLAGHGDDHFTAVDKKSALKFLRDGGKIERNFRRSTKANEFGVTVTSIRKWSEGEERYLCHRAGIDYKIFLRGKKVKTIIDAQ